MNKHKIVTLFVIPLLLGGLTSCGEKTSSSPSNTSSSTSSDSDTITIQFWETFGKGISDEMTKASETFASIIKDNEGVNVKIVFSYQGGYDDLLGKVNKSFSTGTQPTITVAYPDHVAEYLADEGTTAGRYVINLDDYASDSKIGFGKESYLLDGAQSDFVQSFYEEGQQYTRDGTYSLPLMKSTEVMLYNVDAIDAFAAKYDSTLNSSEKVNKFLNGLTWDQFMTFCQFIVNNKTEVLGSNSKLEWPAFYDSDSNLFITDSMQNNIPFVSLNADKTGSADFNNDQSKAMVTKLKGYYDKKLFSTKGISGVYGSQYFQQAQTLFSIGSTGGSGYSAPSGQAFTVGVARVPAFNSANAEYVSQGLSLCMLKAKDDTDGLKAKYGWKFLKYITSTDLNMRLCVRGSEGYVPVRESSYLTDSYASLVDSGDMTLGEEYDYIGKVYDVVHNDINGKYYNTACFKGTAMARTAVGGIISQVCLGTKTIDTAFSDALNETQLAM